MSAILMGRATWTQGISCPEKMVLTAIADVADDHGLAYLLVHTLMLKSSLSERGVQKALTGLEDKGLLLRKIRYRRSSIFKIVVTKLATGRPEPSEAEMSDDHFWDNLKGAPHAPQDAGKGAPHAPMGAPHAPLGCTSCTHTPCYIHPVENHNPSPPTEGLPPEKNQNLFGEAVETPEERAQRQVRDLLTSIADRWKALSESNKLIPNFRKLDERRTKAILRLTEAFSDTTPEALWDEVFARIGESQFLRGLSKPGRDRDEPWAIDFDWLLKKTNFQKVLEGNFRDKRRDHEAFDPISGRRLTPAEIARDRTNERLRSGIERARAAGSGADALPFRLGYAQPSGRGD